MKTKKKVNAMRSCCDRFKNEEHHPECPQRDACVAVKLALVFNLDPDGVSDPKAIIENAIAYLQTVLSDEDPEQLAEAVGLKVKRIA